MQDRRDLLVFSDFNYGCLPQRVVDAIIAAASAKGVRLAADSQSSSQVGDISPWIDYGTLHDYPGGQEMTDGIINQQLGALAPMTGSRPVQSTETGYSTNVSAPDELCSRLV